MNELLRYFRKDLLDQAWEWSPLLKIKPGDDNTVFNVGAYGKLAKVMDEMSLHFPQNMVVTTFSQIKMLGEFMRQGPVIMRPTPDLCHALEDTEIRMFVRDYHQPFPIIGVELPREYTGDYFPCLTLVWSMNSEILMAGTPVFNDPDAPEGLETIYYTRLGNEMTIEDRLTGEREQIETERDEKMSDEVTRIAINLCLLASYRETEITPLPPNVARHRRARDDRLNRLAGRQYQEIKFRDLFVISRPRPNSETSGQPGIAQAPQLRRGHWKRVVHGPRGSLRRWQWINPYYTHRDEEPPRQTVVLT